MIANLVCLTVGMMIGLAITAVITSKKSLNEDEKKKWYLNGTLDEALSTIDIISKYQHEYAFQNIEYIFENLKKEVFKESQKKKAMIDDGEYY